MEVFADLISRLPPLVIVPVVIILIVGIAQKLGLLSEKTSILASLGSILGMIIAGQYKSSSTEQTTGEENPEDNDPRDRLVNETTVRNRKKSPEEIRREIKKRKQDRLLEKHDDVYERARDVGDDDDSG